MPRSAQKKALRNRLATEQQAREAAEAALVEERAKRMFGSSQQGQGRGEQGRSEQGRRQQGQGQGRRGRDRDQSKPFVPRKTREEMTPEEHLEDRQRLQGKILAKMDIDELHAKKHEYHANPAMLLCIGGDRTNWPAVRQLATNAYHEAMSNQRLVPLWLFDDWMQQWYIWSTAAAGTPAAGIATVAMDSSLYHGWMRSLGVSGQKFCRKFPVKWLVHFAAGTKQEFDDAMYEIFVDTDLLARDGSVLWEWSELIDHLWNIVVYGNNTLNPYVSYGVHAALCKAYDTDKRAPTKKAAAVNTSGGASSGAATNGVLKAGLRLA